MSAVLSGLTAVDLEVRAALVAHDHSYAETIVPVETVVLPASLPVAILKGSNFLATESPDFSVSCPTPSVVGSLAEGSQCAKEYLIHRVKPSTKSQYDRVYQIWKDFCAENGLVELEAGYEALAACLSLVMKSSGSLSKVTMLSAAVANEHRRNLKDSPTDHRCIGDLLRSFKSSVDLTRQPVLPITEGILQQMIDKVYHPSHGRDGQKASTVLWRTVWRITMEFHTLGRYSDIIKLKRQGTFSIFVTQLTLFLVYQKTYQVQN